MIPPAMTNLTDALHIPDTQSAPDARHLAIQRVGVKGVRYPLPLRVAGVSVSSPAFSDARSCLACLRRCARLGRDGSDFAMGGLTIPRSAGRGS
mgnify:CR=1 FL=1